jgi:hypothetical protein
MAADDGKDGTPMTIPAGSVPENPFDCGGDWLRAGLHTHTTQSDGRWSPEETVDQYRRAGYDALVITDHSTVTPTQGLGDERMMVLPGQEMHPTGARGILYHLLAVGMRETIQGNQFEPQACIDAARGQGALVYKAHPTWCGLTSAEVGELEGIAGIEVWNATCQRHAKPSSEALWDELLDSGRMLPALATDDCHRPAEHFAGDFCRAWTMVRAAQRTPESLLEALAAGRYYATLGPVIDDFRLKPDPGVPSGWSAEARFSPVVAVSFVGNRSSGRCYDFAADGSGPVTKLSHPVSERARYVRLVVEDDRGLRAWSGPIAVPGAGD